MNYTYEILSVDEDARCMEVSYKAEGFAPVIVGTSVPLEGELLEEVIRRFAPISFWEEKTKKVVAPLVGTKGLIEIPVVDQLRQIGVNNFVAVDLNEIVGN